MKNKNIFLLSADKQTNLVRVWNDVERTHFTLKVNAEVNDTFKEYTNIYITNNEKISLDNSVYDKYRNAILKAVDKDNVDFFNLTPSRYEKICLTNDVELISDGVQEVPSVFLSFYAENPVESVALLYEPKNFLDVSQGWEYFIIFPQKDKFTERNSTDYSKLLSKFENMEGITSDMFDEKDWNRFDRFVKGQLEENWVFERSSGYAGYRNTETGDWIYENEYLIKFKKPLDWKDSTKAIMEAYGDNPKDFPYEEISEQKYTRNQIINTMHKIELEDDKDYSKLFNRVIQKLEEI